jgi:hypothetical protein
VTQTDIPRPPDGWTELPGTGMFTDVMTNADLSIDERVAIRLKAGGSWARHSGWNFNGEVWWADGRWHERVLVHRTARGYFSADSLQELMSLVNNKYGWE